MQAATDRKREVMEPSDKGKCDVIHGCCVCITEGVHPTLHAIASIQNRTSHLINSEANALNRGL